MQKSPALFARLLFETEKSHEPVCAAEVEHKGFGGRFVFIIKFGKPERKAEVHVDLARYGIAHAADEAEFEHVLIQIRILGS